MRRASILILALALLAAGAASAADITVTLNAEIPTFLTMDLANSSGTVATATESADGSHTLTFATPTTAPDGSYLESEDYTLTVKCNNSWNLTVAGDTLTSGTDVIDLEWKYAAAADLTAVPWTSPDGVTDSYVYDAATAMAGVVRHFRFGIPYTWAQRAGTYSGTVTLSVTTI